MKTLFHFIGLNWPFFLGIAVTALVVGTCVTCQNRGETIDVLTADNTAKTHLVDSLQKDNDRLDAERDTCRSEQAKALSNYERDKLEYAQKVADFREKVAGMTTAQKQAAMLDIAGRIITKVHTVTVTATGRADSMLTTPLGTVNLAGKEFPYYTPQQQDLLLWALGEGEILKDQRETTDQAAAVLPVLRNAMYNRITQVLDHQIEARHFLGIGQKQALKQLRADIDAIFKEYLPVVPKTTAVQLRPPADVEESDLEQTLNRKPFRRG